MAALTDFLTKYGTLLQLVLFFVQIAFYIAVGVAAIWATLLFKKLVDFKAGHGKPSDESKKPVSVEEFTD